MDNMFVLFDAIAAGAGVYFIFTFAKLQMAGILFPNSILIPQQKKPKECLDAQGYIAYIKPRLLILGIAMLIAGALNIANAYLKLFGIWVSQIITFSALAFIIWYGVCSVRANKKYW